MRYLDKATGNFISVFPENKPKSDYNPFHLDYKHDASDDIKLLKYCLSALKDETTKDYILNKIIELEQCKYIWNEKPNSLLALFKIKVADKNAC